MRIVCNIALILSVLYLPWWVTACMVIVSGILVVRCYEVIVYGILFDVLYGTSFGVHGYSYVGTTFTAAVFFITLIARTRLAF